MDALHNQDLRRLSHQFEATLTPEQRQLAVVGALKEEMLSPAQQEILKKMRPYLDGLTPEQSRQLGTLDTFAEGYEAGEKAGSNIGVAIGVGIILLIAAIVLGAILRL